MVTDYIEEAMKMATFERLEDGTVYGSFSTDRLRGAWSNADTEEEAREELAEVLEEWVLLRVSRGLPVPAINPEVFAFFGGAVLAFAVVGAAAFGGVKARPGGAPSRAELWGCFHFLSVGLAVGVAWLISAHASSLPGWPLGASAATALYLAVVAAENAVADLKAENGG